MDKYDVKLINNLIFLKGEHKVRQNIRLKSQTINRLDRCIRTIKRNGADISRTDAIILATKLYLDFLSEKEKVKIKSANLTKYQSFLEENKI